MARAKKNAESTSYPTQAEARAVKWNLYAKDGIKRLVEKRQDGFYVVRNEGQKAKQVAKESPKQARLEHVVTADRIILKAVDCSSGKVEKEVSVPRALKVKSPMRVDAREMKKARSALIRWATTEGWLLVA